MNRVLMLLGIPIAVVSLVLVIGGVISGLFLPSKITSEVGAPQDDKLPAQPAN